MVTGHLIRYLCGAVLLGGSQAHLASAQGQNISERKGLTFSNEPPDKYDPKSSASLVIFGQTEKGEPRCNPYEGDTSYDTVLPVLCILDIDAPAPETLDNPRYWSGGILAKSAPHSGFELSTLAQANMLCSQTFG